VPHREAPDVTLGAVAEFINYMLADSARRAA
jgi:hypothetical protein